MTFVVLARNGKQVQAVGLSDGTITLHAGGRLDVYRGPNRLVRCYNFSQISVPASLVVDVVAAFTWAGAKQVGRPAPVAHRAAGRLGFPLD